MRFFKVFTILFLMTYYSHATILYKSPFKTSAPTLASSLVLTEVDGEKRVCGIMKGNLVCISKGGKAEKIADIEGEPRSSVFLDGCFLGVFNREGNWFQFRVCLNGTYEEKSLPALWDEGSSIYLFKDADQKVYASGRSENGSEICLDLESEEIKKPEDIPTPFYLEWPRTRGLDYSFLSVYVFEHDIMDGFMLGALVEGYSVSPILCPMEANDLSACKKLNLGSLSGYYYPFIPFFIFAEGDSLYVTKVVDGESGYLGKGGVFSIGDAESGIPDESFTLLPGYDFAVFGLQGTPYIFKEQGEVAYTIRDGKVEPIFSFSTPEDPLAYLDGKLFWVKDVLVSVDTSTNVIKAFPLPWNATYGSVYSTSERIVVAAENTGVVVFSPDGEMVGKVIPENGRFKLCRVLNGYIAVLVEAPDGSYVLELYDSSLNLKHKLNLREMVFPDFIAGSYLGARSGGGLYIYDLTSGEIASIFSSLGINIDSSFYTNGTVFISGSGISEKGGYSYFTYFDLERFVKEGTENPWIMVDTFTHSVTTRIFAEGNTVYLVSSPFFSEGSMELVSFRPKDGGFILNGLKKGVGVPYPYNFYAGNVNEKLSLVWREQEEVFYLALRDLAEPVPLSNIKDVKVGWKDYFTSRPYPLGLPFTLSGGFYIDAQENSIIPVDENITVYIATPNYDTPYDFYIAILGESGSISFVSPKGFIEEPEPLFRNVEGGMFYRFENIPINALPKGTYYIMIRKAGSLPFDFENPGYKVIEAFRLK